MKKLILSIAALLFVGIASTFATCKWDSYFKYPSGTQSCNGYVYVKVQPKFGHQDISYIKLYVDGQYVRKENYYPFEWGKNGGNDYKLKNMSPGMHRLKAEIYDKCGGRHVITKDIRVSCGGGGGHHGGGHCNNNAYFQAPSKYLQQYGNRVYVKCGPQDKSDISYMELYVDGQKVRREDHYPYEWGKSSGGDYVLSNLSIGRHELKVKVKDKCGNVKYYKKQINVVVYSN